MNKQLSVIALMIFVFVFPSLIVLGMYPFIIIGVVILFTLLRKSIGTDIGSGQGSPKPRFPINQTPTTHVNVNELEQSNVNLNHAPLSEYQPKLEKYDYTTKVSDQIPHMRKTKVKARTQLHKLSTYQKMEMEELRHRYVNKDINYEEYNTRLQKVMEAHESIL